MKTRLYTYIIINCCLIMAACNKEYLERFPLDSPSDETFLTNEAELDMAVTGAYNGLWYHPSGIAIPFAITFDYASDIGWERNTTDLQALGLGLVDSDNGFTGGFWTAFYRGIARCNNIIEKSEPLREVVQEDTYNRLIAETRFLRAYYYFYLNELYGGVPLITKTVLLAESQTPRATKEEVTDLIIAELDAIIPNLLAETKSTNKGRANQGAALALKSRASLYYERWQDAADAAQASISGCNYQLHPKFGEHFLYGGQNSNDIIFAVQYMKGLQVHPIAAEFYSRIAKDSSSKIPVQTLVD